jgi:CheY-like chemotaxis protein
VELPVQRCGKTPPAEPRAPQPAAPSVTRALRILLVEDHEDTRQSMVRLLQRFGHQVEPTGTAGKALELAGQHSFDLVISDLGLPDQSGEELMSQLRERFGLTGVAVSGYGMEEDIARSRIGGFAHHLTKPIQIERLKQIIDEIATQKASGGINGGG